MSGIAVLIDGGYLRVQARQARLSFDSQLITDISNRCVISPEVLFRVMYYDCAPFSGTVTLPVSGQPHTFTSTDQWLVELAQKDFIAVRRGVLKFRGWVPKTIPIATAQLLDSDFKPRFDQKGVDMRIGLDMANFSTTKVVERLALITNDTDCIPAMKHARRAGLQVVLIGLPGTNPAPELRAHADFLRQIAWP